MEPETPDLSMRVNLLDTTVPFEEGKLAPVVASFAVYEQPDGSLTNETQVKLYNAVGVAVKSLYRATHIRAEAAIGAQTNPLNPLALTEHEAMVTTAWDNSEPDVRDERGRQTERSFLSTRLGKTITGVATSMAGIAGGFVADAAPALAYANQVPLPAAKVAKPFEISNSMIDVQPPYEASASDDPNAASSLEQQCVSIGIAEPEIIHPLTMYEAGIRVFTPGMRGEEHVKGTFGIEQLPDGPAPALDCTTEFHRLGGARLQMENPHNRDTWMTLYKVGPSYSPNAVNADSNNIARIGLTWAPPHAWPSWIFNTCVGSEGWLRIREKLTLEMKNIQTGQIDGAATYTIPGLVKGSCAAARRSAHLTRNAKSQWK
jgi:hypothetical protein